MKPSLMKHVGCDILDINPGPAIWSSKVHQLLQPRKHILMEPEEIYSPFIEPLLEATDSTFALHRGSGIVFSQLDSVLSKEQLPNQEELSRDDPRSFEPNETLLVLANISFYPKRPFKGFSSVAHLLLHQMVGSIVHRNFFHKYGQVRMLIWMVDGDRFLALPRHVHTRKKSSVEYAVSCSHITEVASSTLPQKHFPRHFDAEIESARRIKARMEANGIETPAGRESVFFQQLSGITTGAQGLTKTRAEVHRFSTELPALEAQYAAKEFGKYTVEGGDPTQIIPRREITRRGPKRVSDFYSPLYNRMKTLRHLKDSFDRRIAENATWISEQRDLLSQQAVIHNSTGSDAQAERERLLALRKELGERVDSMLDHQNSRMMATQLETDRCSRTDPPGFLYDRREEEPLRVKADEFFPKHELALLDFEPREFWPVLKEDIGNYDVVEYILTSINHFPSWTVAASLKALWPGAYEWLSKECPSLTDPAKGGDDDLSMINVRCLNTEHIKEIIEAWLRWPFKPTRGQLIGRLSHMVHDDDVGDTNYTEGIPDEETEENDEEATEESI
jgi:transcription factor 1